MRLALLVAAAVLSTAIAILGALSDAGFPPPDPPSRPPATATAAGPAPTSRPPRLPRAAVDRQDRVTRAHAARESRALDERPLLSELPLELGPYRIDATGLTPDGERTIVELGGPDRVAAQAAYRQALQALGDPGTAYAPRWTP